MPAAAMAATAAMPAVATEATMLCETVPQTAVNKLAAMNEVAAMDEMSIMNKAPVINEVVTKIKTERAINRLVGVSVIAAIIRLRRALGQGETDADQER